MMKYKTETYVSKKDGKQVTNQVLQITKKGTDEEGIGIKDVVIGKFKFEPRITRGLIAKTGPNAGKAFDMADGIFIWENAPEEESDKLNQWGNLKINFTKAIKDYDFKKIDWQTDRIAFFLRPYVTEANGIKKTNYAVACDRIRALSADEVEAAIELKKDKESFTETELSVAFEDANGTQKTITIPRWAILLDESELATLAK
jgi:hypothetical protein